MSRYRRWGLVVFSGLLLGLSFPPFPVPFAAWFALVPLMQVWSMRRSARAAFVDGYTTFLITFAVAFQWPLFHEMASTAWLSLPGLLIVPMWMAVPVGLSVPFKNRLGPTAGAATFAALFLLMEFALRRGPLAFPWSLLGHSQAELFPVNQLASIGGVPGLSLFVLLINISLHLLLEAFLHRKEIFSGQSRQSALLHPAVAALCALLLLSSRSMPDAAPVLRVGIVQPAMASEHWANVRDDARVDSLLQLTARLPRGLDLVLWPETALPPGERSRARLQRWSDSTGTPLLTGAIGAAGRGQFYNAAHLFRPNRVLQTYRKERLVPFAERVPFEGTFPWIDRLAIPSGGVAGYLPGEDNELLDLGGVRFGPMICFESLFDDAGRAYARADAAMLVVLTQDGWWGNSFGYRQHAAFNRLRAIETGLPLVQASVSGVSGLITPSGRFSRRIGWMEKAAFVVDVPARKKNTLFVQLGDWVTILAALVTFAATAVLAVRKYV